MSLPIQAIILAGGKGTRLAPLTDHLPKPLVMVLGRPMIEYVLEHLVAAGITRVAIAISHFGHLIEDYLGDGSRFGLSIMYLREPEPMGTGGWTKLVDWDQLAPDFLVLNADNLFWIDIPAFFRRHTETASVASIAAIERPVAEIRNYEILEPDASQEKLATYIDRSQGEKALAGKTTGFVSSGWYIMTPAVREVVPNDLPISNETQIWPELASRHLPLGFYPATEAWFDSGTLERLQRVEEYLQNK